MLSWYWGVLRSVPRKILHTSEPPTPSWTVDTKQDVPVLSCCLCLNHNPTIQMPQKESRLTGVAPGVVFCRCHNHVTHAPFLPHSDAQSELQQIILSMSSCLTALSCCHVIDWLDICGNAQLNKCSLNTHCWLSWSHVNPCIYLLQKCHSVILVLMFFLWRNKKRR